jgi:hypothetical protein
LVKALDTPGHVLMANLLAQLVLSPAKPARIVLLLRPLLVASLVALMVVLKAKVAVAVRVSAKLKSPPQKIPGLLEPEGFMKSLILK